MPSEAGSELNRPGMEDAPAGSLFRASYTLTWRDAMAWEQLPSELRGWRKLVFFALPVLAGMAFALSEGWRPAWFVARSPMVQLALLVALVYLLWALWFKRAARRRARRRIPLPLSAEIEDRGDRLVLRIGADEGAMWPDTIRQVVPTPTHVFVENAERLVIVPRRAFADAGQMLAFAARWDEISAQAAT